MSASVRSAGPRSDKANGDGRSQVTGVLGLRTEARFGQVLDQGAELLGITLLDHVILGEDRHFSFADLGWPAT